MSERKILIIAGPNGAGKTTFAQEFLPGEAECPIFVNADLIAAGGHNVPEDVIRRRFDAGLRNFSQVYKPLVDEWVLYDNSGDEPVRLDEGYRS